MARIAFIVAEKKITSFLFFFFQDIERNPDANIYISEGHEEGS